MRTAKCEQCGTAGPLGTMYYPTRGLDQKLSCKSCAERLLSEAGKQVVDCRAAIDPTVCAMCQTDYGNTELRRAGDLPLCENCRATVYDRPFPGWLRLSFAGLLALLVVALVHSAPYFNAAKALVRGERLVNQKQYAAAGPLLEQTLKVAPAAQKPILLAAKAYLLSGQPVKADRILSLREKYEEGPLTTEVKALYERADRAIGKTREADQLQKEEKWEESAKAMHEAASLYPEMPGLGEAAESLDVAASFEGRNFDRFLELNERRWKREPKSSMAAAGMASALACKYAVTRDASFHSRATEMLEKAGSLAITDQEKLAFNEYAERIRHRLATREILRKEEYDRRFRKQAPQAR